MSEEILIPPKAWKLGGCLQCDLYFYMHVTQDDEVGQAFIARGNGVARRREVEGQPEIACRRVLEDAPVVLARMDVERAKQ